MVSTTDSLLTLFLLFCLSTAGVCKTLIRDEYTVCLCAFACVSQSHSISLPGSLPPSLPPSLFILSLSSFSLSSFSLSQSPSLFLLSFPDGNDSHSPGQGSTFAAVLRRPGYIISTPHDLVRTHTPEGPTTAASVAGLQPLPLSEGGLKSGLKFYP